MYKNVIYLFVILLAGCTLIYSDKFPLDKAILEARDANVQIQSTGVASFLFGRYWVTRSYFRFGKTKAPSTGSLGRRFVATKRGSVDGWRWKIRTEDSLRPSYCAWERTDAGGFTWNGAFQAIHHVAQEVIAKPSPPFDWTLYIVPATGELSKRTDAYSLHAVVLSYYLPFPPPTSAGQINVSDWELTMGFQVSTVAREAFQALVGYGNLVPPPPGDAVQEAEATIFGAAATLTAASTSPDIRISFVAPSVDNLSKAELENTPYYLGEALLHAYLIARFGTAMTFSSDDSDSVKKLVDLARDIVRDPGALLAYRDKAITEATRPWPRATKQFFPHEGADLEISASKWPGVVSVPPDCMQE